MCPPLYFVFIHCCFDVFENSSEYTELRKRIIFLPVTNGLTNIIVEKYFYAGSTSGAGLKQPASLQILEVESLSTAACPKRQVNIPCSAS